MTEINEGFPTLIVLVGAGLAIRAGDWPGILAFTAALILYGAMRFLERGIADSLSADRQQIADIKAKLSELAMQVGARGIL